jgi:hypothetical protein
MFLRDTLQRMLILLLHLGIRKAILNLGIRRQVILYPNLSLKLFPLWRRRHHRKRLAAGWVG